MNRFPAAVFVAAFASTCHAQSAPPPCPAGSGVFVLEQTGWKPLYEVQVAGVKSSGVAKAAFSYGIASVKSVLVYRDPSAPETVQSGATFCMNVAPGALRDATIVRVEQKKDHRELQTAKGNIYSGLSLQYRPEDVQKITVAALSDTSSTIAVNPPHACDNIHNVCGGRA